MHPQALEDLRNRLLRPASSTAFADDPTRIFRLARFAARWPRWRIDREAFTQMRAAPPAQLAALPAERVAREMLKGTGSTAPCAVFSGAGPGGLPAAWFEEHERARHIPAGPGSGMQTACWGTACGLWMNWQVMPWPYGWPFATTSEKSVQTLPCCRTATGTRPVVCRLPLSWPGACGLPAV